MGDSSFLSTLRRPTGVSKRNFLPWYSKSWSMPTATDTLMTVSRPTTYHSQRSLRDTRIFEPITRLAASRTTRPELSLAVGRTGGLGGSGLRATATDTDSGGGAGACAKKPQL